MRTLFAILMAGAICMGGCSPSLLLPSREMPIVRGSEKT